MTRRRRTRDWDWRSIWKSRTPFSMFVISHPGLCASLTRRAQNLTLEDSEELHEDIKMYLSLEKLEANLEFWRGLLIVSSSALESLRNERSIGISAYAAQSRANANVKAEITRLLSGKTYDQLVTLQGQVQRKLSSGEPVDVDYWEGLLKELIVWKSKGKLRDMHEVVLNNRLEQLRRKQRDEAVRLQDEIKYALHAPAAKEVAEEEEEDMEIEEEIVQEDWDTTLEPTMMSRIPEELRGAEIVEEGEDRERLVCLFLPHQFELELTFVSQYAQRRSVVQTRFVTKRSKLVAAPVVTVDAPKPAVGKDEEIYQAAVGQGFDEEEELFNMEVEMSKQAYTWEDKYRPRKPRYFCKIHSGFEWNKYAQTHYESVFLSFSLVRR